MEQETEVLDIYPGAKSTVATIQRLVKETGCTYQQATWALLYATGVSLDRLVEFIPWDAHSHQPEPDTEAIAEQVKVQFLKILANN